MLDFTRLDKAIMHFDRMLRSNPLANRAPNRPSPAENIPATDHLSDQERKLSVSLMRINHSGEICAQALYQGQALTARSQQQYNNLLQSAQEETDHLFWCKNRLQDLNGRPSLLNPIWYAGSFAIGALAGCAGDKISLGFLAETEHQVTAHIDRHLRKISYKDNKSRAVLQQMRIDELQHATQAESAGAAQLPVAIKFLMGFTSKIMTFATAKI